MADRPAPDIAFGELPHFDRRLDAGRSALFFEGVLKRQGIQHRRQHAHIVGGGAFHTAVRGVDPTKNVPAADHDGHLHAHGDDLGNFLRHVLDHPRVNAERLLSGKDFSADFEDHPLVGRAAHSSSPS